MPLDVLSVSASPCDFASGSREPFFAFGLSGCLILESTHSHLCGSKALTEGSEGPRSCQFARCVSLWRSLLVFFPCSGFVASVSVFSLFSLVSSLTTKTGVETHQDVSFLYQKGHGEHQRNGFLQVMAGMRQNNKKKLLKKKDGERNLHFASCPPEVQAALRDTRRAEWKKWMKFNAGAILTDEEVRQLTEAGCEMYHTQWIEVDICEEITTMFQFLQSTRVDWSVAEISR